MESVRENPTTGDCEIIVVDNASGDASAEMVRELFGQVMLIANVENLGYAEANNQGIRASSGEYILLLNPDTEVKRGALDALVSFARRRPDAAAIGCRLVTPQGQVQDSCRGFPSPLGVLFEYTRLSRVFPKSKLFGAYRMTYFNYTCEAEVDQPMGSCLLISRSAVDDVGEFDKDFRIFFNEVDWCYRARQRGWKIWFTPDAEVVHHGAASTGLVKPEMAVESHRGLRRFYEKHYKHRLPTVVYRLIMAAIGMNSFFSSRRRSIGESGKR